MQHLTTLLLMTFICFRLVSATDFNHTQCRKLKTPKMRRSCCNLPQTDDIIEKCRKDILAEEKRAVVNKQRVRKDKLELKICIAECEFKAKTYLTAPNEVSMANIEQDLLKRHADDKDYVELLMKGLQKCLQFAKNKTQEISWLRSAKDCNMFPATLLACASEMVYENCPAQKWHVTPECDKMREYLIKCDELAMEKNFHF